MVPSFALETVLVLYGKFFKTVNEAEARDGQKRFDRGVLKAGKEQYQAAIQTVTSDKAFMDDLKRMRNSVAAHHLDTQNSIGMLVDWYATKRRYIAESDHPEINAIIANAVTVTQALHPFAQSLLRAIAVKQ